RRSDGLQRVETTRRPKDDVERGPISEAGVAGAQRAERLRVVTLRLLREGSAAELGRELLLARGERTSVGRRPRQEHRAHLLPEKGRERRLEVRPGLELEPTLAPLLREEVSAVFLPW